MKEALIEMYLAGVFVRRVEDITEALWGTKVDIRVKDDRYQCRYGYRYSSLQFGLENIRR